jgi:hypothetical protein
MAHRPDPTRREEVLSSDDLKALGNSLARLSASAVRDFYERAYNRCRITGRDFPPRTRHPGTGTSVETAKKMAELKALWRESCLLRLRCVVS